MVTLVLAYLLNLMLFASGNVICNRAKCVTKFDTCIHSVTSPTDLSTCFKERHDCNKACSSSRNSSSSLVAMDMPVQPVRRRCMKKCKKNYKGCGLAANATFEEQFICIRNYDNDCRKKCHSKIRNKKRFQRKLRKMKQQLHSQRMKWDGWRINAHQRNWQCRFSERFESAISIWKWQNIHIYLETSKKKYLFSYIIFL